MEPYRFEKAIGRGHYGLVHLVTHEEEKKQYVMKEVHLQGLKKEEVRSHMFYVLSFSLPLHFPCLSTPH